ncbi:MAG TPA: hypothetical protein VGK56_13665 [Anaerolineales bacterium]
MTTNKPNETRAQLRAAIVAIAPVVMLAGFLYHPFIAVLPDSAAVAAAVTADESRWALSHLLVGVGSGILLLAFLAIRSYLREAGEERWSTIAIPLVVLGSTLFTLLPAMEIGLLGGAQAGANVEAAQDALQPWFLPTLLSGSFLFALGVLGFAWAIFRSGILKPGMTLLVGTALVVMGIARFVPLGVFQFYVGGLAGIVALWPLAYVMWQQRAARWVKPSPPIQAT